MSNGIGGHNPRKAANTINDLKILWNQEKEFYKTQEVGSGSQKFVKRVFACEELFNLMEGKGSTIDSKRKDEFIEEARKKGRRADVVIFIDSDIIIPVEVEQYGNIEAGEHQLFNYQVDWQKRFGLLTDGNEWRFYNNTFPIKSFKIENILNNPTEFLTFWQEYITPEYYYESFFQKRGQQRIFEEAKNIDEIREDFFIDITKLIDNFRNKLNLKGYFENETDEREKNKKATEITYAYLIQFILYKTLVDNNFDDFGEDWKTRIIEIHKAIRSKTYDSILNKIRAISKKISERIYKRFSDEQESINERLEEILNQPKQDINDVSVWLDILLFINRYNFSNVKNEIFGYVYENYLKELYEDTKKGQYFTDPDVVEFMLNEMGYTDNVIKERYAKDNDSLSIIDPSCGSGTFLYNATARLVEAFSDNTQSSSKKIERIINDNVFGLDIAEFPLYLAEMNILMRMLPVVINQKYNNPVEQKIKVFKTRDSISEFLDTAINNTLYDANVEYKKTKGQLSLYSKAIALDYESFMRDKGDLEELKRSLEVKGKIPRIRFDFVIGNPPYVSYNECASQHLLFFDLIKDKTNSLVKLNDVYGVNLHSVPGFAKKGRPNPNLYLFFIALGLALLKDDGVICYIIPLNILTAGDFDVMRYHLAKYTTIEKIITFKNALFVGRGIEQKNKVATSSLIFVIRKKTPSPNNQVNIILYQNSRKTVKESIEDISKRKNVKQNEISQKLLLKNFKNWNYIKFNEDLIELHNYYSLNTESLDKYYQHDLAQHYFKSKFYFDGGYDIDESKRIYEAPDKNYYIYPKFDSNSYTILTANGYWLNERDKSLKHYIGLRQGNQEYNLLDSEYKIVWSYANPSRYYFTNSKIIWARNQYNAIGSNNLNELIYLFALFNSPLNMKILVDNVKSENEMDVLFSITSIKTFVKIPIIDKSNQVIKSEIIKNTKEMLEMEKQVLQDHVEFKEIMVQKFDEVFMEKNHLSLKSKNQTFVCKIKGDPEAVKEAIAKYSSGKLFEEKNIALNDLKHTIAFNHQKQSAIKDYIDDLVFALYFNVKLTDISIDNCGKIKAACAKNKFYKLVNSQS